MATTQPPNSTPTTQAPPPNNPPASSSKQQSGNGIVVTTLISFLGVGVASFIAGQSDDAGKTMVVLMWGLLLAWCLMNTSALASMVKNL